MRQQDSSLQIVLPALLLKLGMDTVFLGVLATVVCQIIAFLGVTLITYFLTQSSVISYFSVFFYFNTQFNFSHFYALYFPTSFAAFGAAGTWSAILCIALWLNGFKRSSMLLFGILISIHLAWFIAALAFMGYFLFREGVTKQQAACLLTGMILSLSSFMTFRYFKSHFFQKSQYTTEYDQSPIDQSQWRQPRADNFRTTFMRYHTPRVIKPTVNETFKQLWSLNKASILFFLLMYLLYLVGLLSARDFQYLAIPYALIYIAALMLVALTESNVAYSISSSFQAALLRLIPTRFFNIATAVTPALCLAGFFRLYIQKQSLWLKGLAVLSAFLYVKDQPGTLPFFLLGLLLLYLMHTYAPQRLEIKRA